MVAFANTSVSGVVGPTAQVIANSGAPVLLLSSATGITATGAVSGLTALPYTPSGVVQVYMFLAGFGGANQLYFARFSSTTACQLYTDAAGTVAPSGLTVGVYAGGLSQVNLVTVTVPGGAMGANGVLRHTASIAVSGNANNKVTRAVFGTSGPNYALFQTAGSVNISFEASGRIANRGAGSQVALQHYFSSPSEGNSGGIMLYSNVDTTQPVPVTLTGLLANAADFLIIESYSFELLQGV
jgi:hypothetical protein